MRSPTPVAASDDAADFETQARLAAEALDSQLRADVGRWHSGLSQISQALALCDWGLNLLSQPAQALRLAQRVQRDVLRGWEQALNQTLLRDNDPRFAHPQWRAWPWVGLANAHQAAEDWWRDATALRGVQPHHREMTAFHSRQWLDMLAPSNIGPLNPEVLQRTRERLGSNLLKGQALALDDWRRRQGLKPLQAPPHAFEPGVDVAVTPGKVVHRNHLVELIQYLPLTASVQAEPVFIVPSWIMKYYILDLSPHNSMVKWLVEQGHTVFVLSWRNPDESDALLGLDDYLALGIFDSLAAIARLLPDQAVHACGYCLGGTLLSMAAAALARPAQVAQAEALAPLRSITLLATETDFSEPGEMGVMIDEAQVTLLEDLMAERGYLSGAQMAGSFTFLHARDQVWSRRLRTLWLGEADDPNDLMAWNADVTRMPATMHSEYLRRCYLRNELAEGRFPVEGLPVSLSDIHQPLFVVGTETDHVSPWPSVYKIHRLCEGEITFVLASGGHNAGIVSEPGHPRRHFAQHVRAAGDAWLTPQQWTEAATRSEGSWWPAWHGWLMRQGSGRLVKARTPAAADVLGDAPGSYVHQRCED